MKSKWRSESSPEMKMLIRESNKQIAKEYPKLSRYMRKKYIDGFGRDLRVYKGKYLGVPIR